MVGSIIKPFLKKPLLPHHTVGVFKASSSVRTRPANKLNCLENEVNKHRLEYTLLEVLHILNIARNSQGKHFLCVVLWKFSWSKMSRLLYTYSLPRLFLSLRKFHRQLAHHPCRPSTRWRSLPTLLSVFYKYVEPIQVWTCYQYLGGGYHVMASRGSGLCLWKSWEFCQIQELRMWTGRVTWLYTGHKGKRRWGSKGCFPSGKQLPMQRNVLQRILNEKPADEWVWFPLHLQIQRS